MGNKILVSLSFILLLASCDRKEMKISRSDESIQVEMFEFSPAYIEKNDNGKALLNENNLIGNTHWVLSVDRSLQLGQVTSFLKHLTDKKFNKESVHTDDKDIFFIYSDTLHKQNAYVKMPFKTISLEKLPLVEPLENSLQLYNLKSAEDLLKKYNDSKDLHSEINFMTLEIDKNISVEQFVNLLIELEKQKIDESVNIDVAIF